MHAYVQTLTYIALAIVAFVLPAPSARAQFGDQSIVNMYIYQGQGRAVYVEQLKSATSSRIEMIERACKIDEAGSRKLRFAAKGDLNRFINLVDELHEETKDLNIQDQADMQKAWQAVQPIYEKAQKKNILDDDSLFQKLLPKLLSGEQREAYERHLRLREKTRREAVIRTTIVEIENSMPMLAEQRKQLFELLSTSKPLQNVPEGYVPFLGYIQLCKLEEEKLTAFLDKQQMKVIEQFRERYRGYVWAGN